MNKTQKRQLNLRNKLLAAIAMLLVSSIMMVSTTYAWFTLSTAPEVQGITTTVGANGNLEIALSPTSGNAADLGKKADGSTISEIGASGEDWAVKNLTWGNMISMTETDNTDIYGLGEITLLPSRLNVAAGSESTGTSAKLRENPLKIPVYGADGRISSLSAEKVQVGGRRGDSFDVLSKDYGVRAVGTSSNMSQTALNFQNALSGINNNRITANNLAAKAIELYGSSLAGIALKHANGDDAGGYQEYSEPLNGMVGKLVESANAIEQSLFNALLALGSTEAGKSVKVTVSGTEMSLYEGVKTAMAAGTPLETIWPADTGVALLNTAYAEWSAANTNISTADTKLKALANDDDWSWTEVSNALTTLVNLNSDTAVTMNGKKISEVKNDPMSIINAGGLLLQLNEGSGVYDNIGKLTGKVTTQVTVPAGTKFGSFDVGGVTINITTTSVPNGGFYLVQLRSTIGSLPLGEDTNQVQPIDVTYGYGVDFMFRTNVANSSLRLQTEAAQRVYSDSENAQTMGNGSTMSFKGTNIDSLLSMMDGIRIVFAATAEGTNGYDIYGIAKLDQTNYKISYKYTPEGEGATEQTMEGTLTVTTITDETSGVTTVVRTYAWTDGTSAEPAAGTEVTLTGYVRLYDYTIDGNGLLTFSNTTKDTICSLGQNVATRVTAWVFLDGDAVDNTDVTNSETGISTTGSLNLQFASSAALVPMENTDLFNGPTTTTTP